ncbi:nucleotide exchange factor GrpE [Candidatus Peregrinibacteria bacterium]|nr:nucleotide exchange factor GrpE [Candidatus Peregrinibacteria bacterium]
MDSKKDDNNQKDGKIDLKKKLEEARKEAKNLDEAISDETVLSEQNPDELAKTKEELSQMTETAKRMIADMTNLKRRHEEDRKTIIFMANTDLIKSLLPIIDNLNRAKQHFPQNPTDDVKKWYEGLEISINQLNKILQDFGVVEIEALGKPFDPNLHEASSLSSSKTQR